MTAPQPPAVHVRAVRTPGLGDATYVLSHHGQAVVVDPQRDVERFLDFVQRDGVRVRFVLETHVHNDYVSGGRELARRAQAELVLPAGAGVAFDHTPAFHLEDLSADAGLVVRPIHTPGHTPEHVSYLVLIDGQPVALFSGGSLLVGSAGRPDLLGIERAEQLARLQFGSVHRLAALPDALELYPTHGAGSFCASTDAGRSTSSIGLEKQTNPLLACSTPAEFVRTQLAALQPYPRYYAAMGPINTLGPTPIPRREVPLLEPHDVLPAGLYVVDARPREAFASGHVPGAIGVELASDFSTWVGWLTPFNAPLVLVLDPDQDLDEAVVQLARIGFDDVRGVMRGMDAWTESGQPLEQYELADPASLAEALRTPDACQVLDVRGPAEWQSGSLPGAVWRYVPDLLTDAPTQLDPDQPVWVVCASGFRASIAASLLQRHGYLPVVVARGGVAEVRACLSQPVPAGV